MGYYTDFYLEGIYDRDTLEDLDKIAIPQVNALLQYLDGLEGYRDTADFLWYAKQLFDDRWANLKWYDYDTDMSKISRIFPDWIFRINGSGEKTEDMWHSAFCDGNHSSGMIEFVEPDLELHQWERIEDG